MTIIINEGFWYEDEIFIEAGEYEYQPIGINGWPMIKVNDEWLDICED